MMGTMKHWAMDVIGRDRLTLRSTPKPIAAAGEVLVKVSAVSLNYRDKLVIETGMGLPIAFPFVPVSDMAGVVEEIGRNVSRFKPGDRVISTFTPDWIEGRPGGDAANPLYRTLGGFYPGVLAEYVAFSENWFSAAPATLDDAEASTLPVAGLTAWFALVELGALKAGSTVLVQGTGGVALFGLQIAKACGARTLITSSSAEKLVRAKALGADHGLNRVSGNWVEELHRLTDGRGADHILEIGGGAGLARSVNAIAVGGRITVIGVLDGFEISAPVLPMFLKSPIIQGISVGHRRALEDLVRAIDVIGLKPVIDKRYAFCELPAALDHLGRGAFGKIVVEVG